MTDHGFKKVLKIAAIAMFIFALLFSVVFEATEEVHDCTGENCEICACLSVCREVLSKCLAVTAAIAVFHIFRLVSVHLLRTVTVSVPTQVELKIRLNN